MSELRSLEQHSHGLFILALVVCLTFGCKPAEPTIDTIEPQGRVEENSVEVTIVDRAEFDAALVHLKGQVILVDCWATWCIPCLKQLPHSMELATKNAQDGLVVLTLSFDDPSKVEAVQKILESKGGQAATHFLSANGGSSQSMDDFEITGGALPHYKLFDRAGKLVRVFALDPSAERQFTTDGIDEAIRELLSEPSS
jgi:thiol-disulfide isomerase/thioredoxin